MQPMTERSGVCVWIDSERKIGSGVCCVTRHDPTVTQRLCRDLCQKTEQTAGDSTPASMVIC